METANRRITAMDMSTLPRYADGGLIGKLKGMVGMGTTETVTQKYARQDAERAAKAPAVPTPTPAASPAANTISGYAAGTAMKEREKAAGLKKGGAIKGKGTGTSDDVPIMASNGEFMIKAKAVKKIGIAALNHLNAIADTPEKETKAEDKAEGGAKGEKKEAFKYGGAVRKMADGGLIQSFGPPIKELSYAIKRRVTPDGLTHDDPQGNEYTGVGQFAGAGRGKVNPAPAIAGYSKGGAIRKMAGIPHMYEGGSVDEAQRRAAMLAQIPTGGDNPAPAPDGQSSTELGRNVRNTLNAFGSVATGAGALPRATGALSTLASNAAATFGAARAANSLGTAAELAPALPVATTTQTPPVAQAAPQPALPAPATAAATMAAPPSNVVTRTGNSYTGPANISGNVTFADAQGAVRPGRGGVSSLDTSQGYVQDLRDLARIDDAKAQQNANIQGQADYAQNKVLEERGLAGNRSALHLLSERTANQTAQRGQDQQAAQQGAAQKMAQQRFGLDAAKAGADNQFTATQTGQANQILAAQKALVNPANTPTQQAAAEEQLRILTKSAEKAVPTRFTVLHGAKTMDGQEADRVIDGEGKLIDVGGKSALPPGLVVGAPYKGADGDHRLPNGGTMTVKGGKVTAIK